MTGFPPLVVLSDPAEIGAMFAAPADALLAGRGAETTMPIVGEQSFMLQDGTRHVGVRKAVVAGLRSQAVQRRLDLVADVARRAVAQWPRDVPLQLHPRLRSLTLDLVLRMTFAATAQEHERELRSLREALLRMLAVTASAAFPEPVLRHGPGRVIWQRFLREQAVADELLYALLDARCDLGAEREEDLVDVLIATHRRDRVGWSRKRLRDDIMSLVLAGHETTAAELSWAFQLLAHHPTVLDRLLAELHRGEDDAYLAATVQEILRHRPVFPFTIPRAVSKTIELGGWTHRAPVRLVGCVYLVHHDTALYPDPHKFNPERFLAAPPGPQVWLPWGGGRRRCPGLHLATLEMQTVLRTTLLQLTPRPAAKRIERPRWRSVIVVPNAGARVVLESRSKRFVPAQVPGRASGRLVHERLAARRGAGRPGR